MAARPSPQGWSAAECLAHLALTTDAFSPAWREALAGARPALDGDRRFRTDLFGRLFIWALEPPPRFRSKAPADLRPPAPGGELERFLESQDRLLEFLAKADGLPLDRIRVHSPVSSLIQYSLWSSFQVTNAHQHRHLAQAERAAGV